MLLDCFEINFEMVKVSELDVGVEVVVVVVALMLLFTQVQMPEVAGVQEVSDVSFQSMER